MKVIKISILDGWENIDIENSNMDVSIETDDGYSYTLSFATPKHIKSLMDQEKMDFYGPGSPFLIVRKLTSKIIEQAVKDFTEDELDNGYWLKVYHFGGWQGAINEKIFNKLKAKHFKKRKKFDEELNEDELAE